jgi:hypothetical protein
VTFPIAHHLPGDVACVFQVVLRIMMTRAVKVGPPSAALSGVWWPLRHGLGLFLGDLPQVRLPVRLVLVQGRASAAACSSATFASASARTAWACAASSRALSAFARARSAFPGGSRLVWLLTPPSIMMLATFLISPMTTASWGSAPQRVHLPLPGP